MRTTADRIRHAISFELIGILLATPLAAFAFHLEGGDSVVVVVASATVAMLWNYVYSTSAAPPRKPGRSASSTPSCSSLAFSPSCCR
jgi:uncharacterized membrane protein